MVYEVLQIDSMVPGLNQILDEHGAAHEWSDSHERHEDDGDHLAGLDAEVRVGGEHVVAERQSECHEAAEDGHEGGHEAALPEYEVEAIFFDLLVLLFLPVYNPLFGVKLINSFHWLEYLFKQSS